MILIINHFQINLIAILYFRVFLLEDIETEKGSSTAAF